MDRLDLDLRPDRAPDQVRHAEDELVDVGRLGVERLAPREGEEAVRQRCRALRGPLGCDEVAIEVVDPPLCHALLQEVQAARDAGQQVVEIVREAAGELAHSLHLLALAQRLLGLGQCLDLFSLGRDVTTYRVDQPFGGSGGPGDPTVAAISVTIAVVEARMPSALGQLTRTLDRVRHVVGMDEIEQVAAEHFALAPAE